MGRGLSNKWYGDRYDSVHEQHEAWNHHAPVQLILTVGFGKKTFRTGTSFSLLSLFEEVHRRPSLYLKCALQLQCPCFIGTSIFFAITEGVFTVSAIFPSYGILERLGKVYVLKLRIPYSTDFYIIFMIISWPSSLLWFIEIELGTLESLLLRCILWPFFMVRLLLCLNAPRFLPFKLKCDSCTNNTA